MATLSLGEGIVGVAWRQGGEGRTICSDKLREALFSLSCIGAHDKESKVLKIRRLQLAHRSRFFCCITKSRRKRKVYERFISSSGS
jgi:hypothetical protein